MAVNLSPVAGAAAQFFDNSGNVLTGGKLYTYDAGTTTPSPTYTTNSGAVAHPNPIILNASGRVPDSGEIWLTDSISYKFVLKDQNDVLIATYDNLVGINSNFISYTTQNETATATQGQTVFTLTSMQYQPATNNLAVFVNGSRQILTLNYVETSSTIVTFVDGLNVGDVVQFTSSTSTATNVTTAANVSYNEGSAGAVNRNVQQKLQESISVKDFSTLTDAVNAIGSTAAVLLINDACSITNDLIIPSNITLQVAGAGVITVPTGKRLFINGAFIADRLQKCFIASLFTNTIVASVNGNALNVTSVGTSTLTAGQIISGTGLLSGSCIANAYGNTGIGQYALNNYNGIIASESMTLTGASVVFAPGTVGEVYPQWFGAVADGTTDCTTAIQHSVYCQVWGGKVKFPAGSYKTTASTVLHGNITIEGDGGGNIFSGSPPPAQLQISYVYLNSNNASIFTISGISDNIIIDNLTFGTALPPTLAGGVYVPVGTNRKCIVLDGHAPQYLFNFTLQNCFIFGFDTGLLINDSWAPQGDGVGPAGTYWNGTASVTYYDWGVQPATVRNCEFIGNLYGILINTNNLDMMRVLDCGFSLPTNGSGVYLKRSGLIKLDTCFATGYSLANANFVGLQGVGTVALKGIELDGCQAEACAHFLNYSASSTTDLPLRISAKNCYMELGSDVYLGVPAEWNGINNTMLANLYVDSIKVKVNSINDFWGYLSGTSGPTYNVVVASGDTNSFWTLIPGKNPPSGQPGPYFNGLSYVMFTGSGTPIGAITPTSVGEEYLDTGTSKWYKSTGTTNTSWVALN